VQNSGNSSYDSSVLDENYSGDESETESNSGIFTITNQNFITRNIEAWRNNAIKKEEEEEKNKRNAIAC